MQIVEVAARIEASADRAWTFVGNFGGDALTHGYVHRVEVQGQGLGALRVYHLDPEIGGGRVIERLEWLDHRERVIEYSMTDNGPLLWAEYAGHISVTPAGEDACIVLVRTQFTPIESAQSDYAAMSRGNIAKYLSNLAAAVDGAT